MHVIKSTGRRRTALLLVAICVASLISLPLHAMAWRCGDLGTCVCISWSVGNSGYIEVRCPADGAEPSGWTTGDPGDADGSRGSFGGSGSKKMAPSPLPGMVLTPETNQKVSGAKTEGVKRLRGEQEFDEGTGKPIWIPTACSDLFANSPMSSGTNPLPGAQLLSTYVIFRDGTGVKDKDNRDRCAEGAAAWTTCCSHDPVIFICPAKFNSASFDDRIKYLIHETLHVAGQMEDLDGTIGPDDPPNSGQINADVDAACNGS
ncbi:MAG TPA: hypothetical protein VF787_10300 [Thermoanaerobaculia bacterium]